MPAYDDSFNAEGPTVVAFETVGLTPSDVPAFGVAVFAHQCGVNGVALTDVPAQAHRVAPNLVGVHGLGEVEGVQGEGPIGMHGIGSVGGVQGEGPIGVQGLGESEGVHGEGLVGVNGVGINPGSFTRGLGVHGEGRIGVQGEGDTIGVLGFSKLNRAGVFHTGGAVLPSLEKFASDPSAQIHLAPVRVRGAVEGHLPRVGQAGDLLAVVSTGRRQAAPTELWFCIRSGSDDPAQPGATWAKVQFETTFVVP